MVDNHTLLNYNCAYLEQLHIICLDKLEWMALTACLMIRWEDDLRNSIFSFCRDCMLDALQQYRPTAGSHAKSLPHCESTSLTTEVGGTYRPPTDDNDATMTFNATSNLFLLAFQINDGIWLPVMDIYSVLKRFIHRLKLCDHLLVDCFVPCRCTCWW